VTNAQDILASFWRTCSLVWEEACPSGESSSSPSARPVAMSLSPKHHTTTSFSVTDILSPFEESYKKTSIEAAIPPLIPGYPYHRGSTQTSPNMASMGGMNGTMAANPYNYMPQLSHHTPSFSSQYCNGSELSPYSDPMQGVRNTSTGWYATNADPRLASKYLFTLLTESII
jgi:hypothetical protein